VTCSIGKGKERGDHLPSSADLVKNAGASPAEDVGADQLIIIPGRHRKPVIEGICFRPDTRCAASVQKLRDRGDKLGRRERLDEKDAVCGPQA